MAIKILAVEDDISIITGIVDLLESEGYEVVQAIDGEKAIELYASEIPDLVILDIMIPKKSGYDVCRYIRSSDNNTPILMLTAKGQEVDKVVGLELGADDYVVKPFGINELLARIRALLRRSQNGNGEAEIRSMTFGNVEINFKKFEALKDDEKIDLSQREIDLLKMFKMHEGEVLKRFDILEEVWGVEFQGTTRTLDQHVAKLRQKIEDDPANPKFIKTVHGAGYRFVGDS